MSKARATGNVRSDGPTGGPLDARELMKGPRELFGVSAEAQAHGIGRGLRMCQDYLAFLSNRLDCDRQLMEDLATAREPADLSAIWAPFFETAQRDYAQQFQRMMGFYVDSAQETAADLQHQVEEAVEIAAKAGAEEAEAA